MTFLYFLFIAIFILLCVVLCFVVLMQESKSSGLGASFGGEGAESLFGSSSADVLKRFTGYLAFFFLLLCLVLSLWTGVLGSSPKKDRLDGYEDIMES